MADVLAHQDHKGASRILNLPDAVLPGEPATLGQLQAATGGVGSAQTTLLISYMSL